MIVKQGLEKEKDTPWDRDLRYTLPTDILTALAIHNSYRDYRRRGVYLAVMLYGIQLVAM